ncbi:MAG: tellurite resistance TerB family protein [Halopseudomonas yangmingensis]
MNTRSLLDQLLKSGSDLLQGNSNPGSTNQTSRTGTSPLGSLLAGAGGGAAISLLLGSKKARKMGGKAITYGGLAALGVVAWKAWQNYQQNQTGAAPQAQPIQTVDRLPAPQAEQHSQAILRALIAAAKADGHIDQRERELIDNEIARLSNDQSLLQWFDRELQKPLDPAEVAGAADSPELAAEMFLASLLMVDQQSYMERAYLDELARQLRLPAELRSELERQAQQAG